MFGVTIPHRLTAELPLHKGAKERYIAARCDIRLRRAIYFRFAEMRYVHRFRTMNVVDGEERAIISLQSVFHIPQDAAGGVQTDFFVCTVLYPGIRVAGVQL